MSIEVEESLLKGRVDTYKGFIVDPQSLPSDLSLFDSYLTQSMKVWRQKGLRGLWLQIPIGQSALIPAAVTHGFTFHHAQNDYVMMTQWIDPKDDNKIPRFASHYVGVGAVVINDRDEILVVVEKYRDRPGRWKVPGGLVDPGEDLGEAAVRETWEETGIKAEFRSVMAFREKHQYLWGKSDLYFVCRLSPLTFEIKKEDQEIEECRWMPLAEFYNNPEIYPTQKAIARLAYSDKHRPDGRQPFQGDFYSEIVPVSGGAGMKFFQNGIANSIPLGSPYGE